MGTLLNVKHVIIPNVKVRLNTHNKVLKTNVVTNATRFCKVKNSNIKPILLESRCITGNVKKSPPRVNLED
ncbi:hypothetical protein AMR72_03845 [Flavobacterium psychrophilum]|nr:hypothetical protein AMR72_03845 [Flavobacterium psychrophilum]